MKSIKDFWLTQFSKEESTWWKQKKERYSRREASVLKIYGAGHIFQRIDYDNKSNFRYLLYLSIFIKQKGFYYVEEQVIPYQFELINDSIVNHQKISKQINESEQLSLQPDPWRDNMNQRFTYDPRAAVRYAEHWWNSYNPAYEKFTVDCTNYVSQCLFAGGAPMRGEPVRDLGWWYGKDNWSYSWAVAHSLRWYLGGSTIGLQGKEVQAPDELSPGDVICYDFQGDGRWDHNTIVVAIDAQGMPLVNAHTDNSRHRYWSYEDSTAWTPNIKYKFFQIGN